VQSVEKLRDGYGLKLTIARYYTPSGRSIQAKGIQPDIIIKRRFTDKEDMDDVSERVLKEKDLQNHLKAVPEKDQEKKGEGGEKEKKDKKQSIEKTKFIYGRLKPEQLLTDNQVTRALDILLSYEIFKDVQK
jgi:carboxyl-terminal processing protease